MKTKVEKAYFGSLWFIIYFCKLHVEIHFIIQTCSRDWPNVKPQNSLQAEWARYRIQKMHFLKVSLGKSLEDFVCSVT